MRKMSTHLLRRLLPVIALVALTGVLVPTSTQAQPGPQLPEAPIPGADGVLIGADYWSDEPVILSAGLGFEGIIGVDEINEETMREAGAGWIATETCTNGDPISEIARTAAVSKANMAALSTGQPDFSDALPIVFSWPVATETIDITDFQYTLNNGELAQLESYTMFPNWEYNERNVVVLFGEYANRGSASDDDAIFPVRLDIVGELILIGPGGEEFNAEGLFWETDATPYDSGPSLVGAKINHVDPAPIGEGGVPFLTLLTGAFPNDEVALYDEGDFRIRVLTTGGFSPDGVTALFPNAYENFFRVHATGPDGETVLLEEVGVDYEVAGGTLRVVGLADTGVLENPDAGIYYDVCYGEDRDNYIDIILVGDEEAARNVTFVEIPSLEGGYSAFYNPGGPGPDGFEGVTYTAPGPPDLEPVINALDDPMRVTRFPTESAFVSVPQGELLYAQSTGMFPEGIEWDATNGQFLVGSVLFGNVWSVQDTGVVRPFIVSPNLTNTIGIHIDAATNRLLVAVGNLAANLNEDVPGFARLGIYDMATGEELVFVDLGDLIPDGRHFANDVTVDAEGNAYVTDTLSPVIYRVDMDGNAEVFLEAPELVGFNGIDYHPNGYLLVAMNDDNALYKVPIDNPAGYTRVDLSEPLSIDGMVINEDLQVVAVRQLNPMSPDDSLVLVSSDDDWATATVVATAPAITRSFPTTVTLRDGQPYVVHANFLALQTNTIPRAYEILGTTFTPVE